MSSKLLFIGGSGFIGKNIMDSYSEEFEIVNYDIVRAGVEKTFIDAKENTIDSCFELTSYQYVFFLVNTLHPSDRYSDESIKSKLDINLILLMQTIEQCATSGSPLVYFSSGGTVYGNHTADCREDTLCEPISFYGWIKKACEDYISYYGRQNELKYVILRLSNPFGKHQNINGMLGFIGVAINKILSSEQITIYGDGNTIRDYIPISYFLKTLKSLLEQGTWNEVYNVGSGVGLSNNEILEILRECSNEDISVNYDKLYKGQVNRNVLDISKINQYTDITRKEIENEIKKFFLYHKEKNKS